METPLPNLPLPFEAFVFTTQELIKIPVVTEVKFVQIYGGPPLQDAQGGNLPPAVQEQIIHKPDIVDGRLVKPMTSMQGQVFAMWKVFGRFIKPWMPGPALNLFLQEVNHGKPIPVLLVLTKFNIDTFEFEAMSQGDPQVAFTRNGPAKTLSN